ncbi:MAG TPA: protein kinase [Gemmataceae bacterium]|jgi:serine/threonine-protein kinase
MPATVALTVVQGKNKGQQFVFDQRTTCIIGRDDECQVRFPKDKEHQSISRHHCLLDINPPDVRIRDLGSRAGTYINDSLIGKRDSSQTAEEGSLLRLSEFDLKDGDQIKIGKTIFQVTIRIAAACATCAAEIPAGDQDRARLSEGGYRCAACRRRESGAVPEAASQRAGQVCTRCGRQVSAAGGSQRAGDVICAACRAEPGRLVQQLLEMARSGSRELIAVQGYRVEKELGHGGMGAVYLAVHETSGERVALKVMLPQVAAGSRARELFLREAANTTSLRHRHVVHLHDLGCSQGMFFFTLEYCEGGSVADLLAKRGRPLAVEKAVKIILQVLDGLEYAHGVEVSNVKLADGSSGTARGLVHRDVKPHNLFLARSGAKFCAKVGDYGLAKAFDMAGLSGMSATGTAAGTPVFMPRQQLVDFKYARPEVDVWAAAASLYYMLTLAYPRDFPKKKDPWQVVLQTDPIPIRDRDASIPKKLADVIDTALREKPAIPFQSAAELRQALQEAL